MFPPSRAKLSQPSSDTRVLPIKHPRLVLNPTPSPLPSPPPEPCKATHIYVRENALDVVGETHVKHLISLVQHGVLHVAQVKVSPLKVVDNAPGRRHEDVKALPQSRLLRSVRRTAMEHVRTETEGAAESGELLVNLQQYQITSN